MKALKNTALAIAVLAAAGSFAAYAADVDPSSLYELSTEGTTRTIKAGEKGKLVIQITARPGAHISDEAPLKIELSGTRVKTEKENLTLADSVAKKAEGQKYANPRFEVPLIANSAGHGSVDAKMTFFVCTETICSRQKKTLSLPIEVQ
ncbi:MAG: hypothetical protein IRZ16_03510 [Myxococcaceae bacterium]|nr:hypothetical protein [Myxococcaceae bacterium]